MDKTIHDIATVFLIHVPLDLHELSKNKELINCFEHSCEFGLYPCFEPEKRDDYNYWFPIYFEHTSECLTQVYMINLHPDAKEILYVRRYMDCKDKNNVEYLESFKKKIKDRKRIPLPEELEEYSNSSTEIKTRANDLYCDFKVGLKLEKLPAENSDEWTRMLEFGRKKEKEENVREDLGRIVRSLYHLIKKQNRIIKSIKKE